MNEIRRLFYLNVASNHFLETALKENDGSLYTVMASILFNAFTFEAYINHLSRIKLDNFEKIERKSTFYKYKLLCNMFSVEINYNKRPQKTLENLFKFRNEIAHGKTIVKEVNKEVIVSDKYFKSENFDKYMPKVFWEEYCVEKNAIEVGEDIQKLIIELNLKAGEGDFPFVNSGSKIGMVY